MTTESRRAPDEAVIGTVIGHYQVTGILNQGGMGAVYRAVHPLIGKPAAIKLLLPDLSSHEEMVRRFFNEAKAASAIRHPGIVEIFDFGYHTDGRAYIVMEFLDGQSLAERLTERGRLPELEAAVLTRAMAGALAAAHAKSIVHRDLKPDNVFLVPDPDMPTGERTKVLDFGIAKLTGNLPTEVSHTRTGALMGTPLYMAPEQARGAGEVDARADLYSLGCMLYEMLCGQPPFVAEGAGEIIAMQLFAEVVPPREIVPELSPEIEQITLGLLEKDPSKRTTSARALADQLAAVLPRLSGRLSAAVPVPSPSRMRLVVAPPRPGPTPQPAPAQPVIARPAIARRAIARREPEPTTLGGSAAHVVPSIAPDDLGARGGRTRGRIVAASAIAAASALVAFVIVKQMRAPGVSTPTTSPPTAATAAPPTAATAPPGPAPAPAPATITLSLVTDPSDAAIAIDGAPRAAGRGGTIELPRDGAEHTLVASAPGHVSKTTRFRADRDQSVAIALAAEVPPLAPIAPVLAPPPPPARAPQRHGRTPTPLTTPPMTTTTSPAPPASHSKGSATSNGSPIETNL